MRLWHIIFILFVFFSLGCEPQARADLKEGQQAKLFKSIDENLKHVDMADLIDGRPLVLAVGSCS